MVHRTKKHVQDILHQVLDWLSLIPETGTQVSLHLNKLWWSFASISQLLFSVGQRANLEANIAQQRKQVVSYFEQKRQPVWK